MVSGEEPVSEHVYRVRTSPSFFFDVPVFRYVCRCGCTIGGFASEAAAAAAAEEHIAEVTER